MMDFKSGYHQIPMRKKGCEKTAFVTHVGVYEWVVMPFGLKGAPAVFSKVMAKVLRGIDGKFTTAYLDDILVWSPSPEAHLCHLQEVFDRLRAAGLKLKREKCDFFQQRLEYLGHYVTPEGITPCQDKVNAIVSLQPQTTPKEVRSFIGTVRYYRRYIPEFSEIARPLTFLTRKSKEFIWTKECQEAFQTLKDALISDPILVFPDMNKEMAVHVDASDVAVGAVLVQHHNDGPHPVYYVSQALTPTQSGWPIIEREAYAMIFAIRKFRSYLYGKEFTVYTDHQPLKYLLKSEIKNVKVQKWAMEISEYQCEIEYISGSKNVQADFLSRPPKKIGVINTDRVDIRKLPPETEVDESEGPTFPVLRGGIDHEPLDMAGEQEKDRSLRKLKGDHKYTQVDGILYYITEEPMPGLKLVVPKHLKKDSIGGMP